MERVRGCGVLIFPFPLFLGVWLLGCGWLEPTAIQWEEPRIKRIKRIKMRVRLVDERREEEGFHVLMWDGRDAWGSHASCVIRNT